MTISDKMSFLYDEKHSDAMGIIKVSSNSGLFSEPFAYDRDIIEESVPYRDTPYFYGIQRKPIEFDMRLFFEKGWTDETFNKVKRWLEQVEYKELIFDGSKDKIYYCIPTGQINLTHNGAQEGYIDVKMRCDSPFIYSPVYRTIPIDTTLTDGEGSITVTNRGSHNIKPVVTITKKGGGDILLRNMSQRGLDFEIKNLVDEETITVDCEYEEINTSIPFFSRYDSFNDGYLDLGYGDNYILIEGDCIITFEYRYKVN